MIENTHTVAYALNEKTTFGSGGDDVPLRPKVMIVDSDREGLADKPSSGLNIDGTGYYAKEREFWAERERKLAQLRGIPPKECALAPSSTTLTDFSPEANYQYPRLTHLAPKPCVLQLAHQAFEPPSTVSFQPFDHHTVQHHHMPATSSQATQAQLKAYGRMPASPQLSYPGAKPHWGVVVDELRDKNSVSPLGVQRSADPGEGQSVSEAVNFAADPSALLSSLVGGATVVNRGKQNAGKRKKQLQMMQWVVALHGIREEMMETAECISAKKVAVAEQRILEEVRRNRELLRQQESACSELDGQLHEAHATMFEIEQQTNYITELLRGAQGDLDEGVWAGLERECAQLQHRASSLMSHQPPNKASSLASETPANLGCASEARPGPAEASNKFPSNLARNADMKVKQSHEDLEALQQEKNALLDSCSFGQGASEMISEDVEHGSTTTKRSSTIHKSTHHLETQDEQSPQNPDVNAFMRQHYATTVDDLSRRLRRDAEQLQCHAIAAMAPMNHPVLAALEPRWERAAALPKTDAECNTRPQSTGMNNGLSMQPQTGQSNSRVGHSKSISILDQYREGYQRMLLTAYTKHAREKETLKALHQLQLERQSTHHEEATTKMMEKVLSSLVPSSVKDAPQESHERMVGGKAERESAGGSNVNIDQSTDLPVGAHEGALMHALRLLNSDRGKPKDPADPVQPSIDLMAKQLQELRSEHENLRLQLQKAKEDAQVDAEYKLYLARKDHESALESVRRECEVDAVRARTLLEEHQAKERAETSAAIQKLESMEERQAQERAAQEARLAEILQQVQARQMEEMSRLESKYQAQIHAREEETSLLLAELHALRQAQASTSTSPSLHCSGAKSSQLSEYSVPPCTSQRTPEPCLLSSEPAQVHSPISEDMGFDILSSVAGLLAQSDRCAWETVEIAHPPPSIHLQAQPTTTATVSPGVSDLFGTVFPSTDSAPTAATSCLTGGTAHREAGQAEGEAGASEPLYGPAPQFIPTHANVIGTLETLRMSKREQSDCHSLPPPPPPQEAASAPHRVPGEACDAAPPASATHTTAEPRTAPPKPRDRLDAVLQELPPEVYGGGGGSSTSAQLPMAPLPSMGVAGSKDKAEATDDGSGRVCVRCGLNDAISPGRCAFHPFLIGTPGPFLYTPRWHACREGRHTPASPGCYVRHEHFYPPHLLMRSGSRTQPSSKESTPRKQRPLSHSHDGSLVGSRSPATSEEFSPQPRGALPSRPYPHPPTHAPLARSGSPSPSHNSDDDIFLGPGPSAAELQMYQDPTGKIFPGLFR